MKSPWLWLAALAATGLLPVAIGLAFVVGMAALFVFLVSEFTRI